MYISRLKSGIVTIVSEVFWALPAARALHSYATGLRRGAWTEALEVVGIRYNR
jgi:hypothetical protein